MIKTLGSIAAILLVASSPLWARTRNLSGTWESHVFGSKVVVHLNQKGRSIAGVARVYGPFGKKTTYHFRGMVEGNRVQAAHYSGHSFVGMVGRNGVISGVLTTRQGRQIPVTASRR